MKYVISARAEIEAMQWEGGEPFADDTHPAREIVDWVNANGGEARYEPNHPWSEFGNECPCNDFDVLTRVSTPHTARIAVRTINGWAYATPGHYVVMGEARFTTIRLGAKGNITCR